MMEIKNTILTNWNGPVGLVALQRSIRYSCLDARNGQIQTLVRYVHIAVEEPRILASTMDLGFILVLREIKSTFTAWVI